MKPCQGSADSRNYTPACATEPVPTVHTNKYGTEVRSMGMVMGIETHRHTNFSIDNMKGVCVDNVDNEMKLN